MRSKMNLYWDNAGTTCMDRSVIERTVGMLHETFHNPSALYEAGRVVKKHIEAARSTVAAALHVNPNTITFLSGATEANNWAFYSGFKNKKGNIVISEGEHASVYRPAMALKNKGVDVRVVPLSPSGTVDIKAFEAAVDEQTALVSVIHCSNETGAVNPIRDLVGIVRNRAKRALFHSDGVQAFKKIPTDLSYLGVDLYSVSAHKIGGPKGIGALYSAQPLAPMLLGGGQEGDRRSGTENTFGIVSFAQAVQAFSGNAPRYMPLLRKRFAEIEQCTVNGDETVNSGYILSVSVHGIKAEILQHMASDRGLYIGTGSACSSQSRDNRILRSMGVSPAGIAGNIRISLLQTNEEEIDLGMNVLQQCIRELRERIHG